MIGQVHTPSFVQHVGMLPLCVCVVCARSARASSSSHFSFEFCRLFFINHLRCPPFLVAIRHTHTQGKSPTLNNRWTRCRVEQINDNSANGISFHICFCFFVFFSSHICFFFFFFSFKNLLSLLFCLFFCFVFLPFILEKRKWKETGFFFFIYFTGMTQARILQAKRMTVLLCKEAFPPPSPLKNFF